MITFVSFSQDYLSDYLIRNSKDNVGKKLDPAKLSELLGMPEMAAQPAPSVLILWSVTCAPCLEKLKNLPDVGLESGQGNRRLIPINTDPETSRAEAQAVLAKYLPSQPFYHDREKTLVTELEIDYLPTNIYLTAEGVIEKITVGEK
jgi:hypothetical protein